MLFSKENKVSFLYLSLLYTISYTSFISLNLRGIALWVKEPSIKLLLFFLLSLNNWDINLIDDNCLKRKTSSCEYELKFLSFWNFEK